MDYIYKKCPVFALCLQRSGKDKWADAPDFNSTCFIPSQYYCTKNLEAFRHIDFFTSNLIVLNSTVPAILKFCDLEADEYVPNCGGIFINVQMSQRGNLSVNGLEIRHSVSLSNGIVHIVDGILKSV